MRVPLWGSPLRTIVLRGLYWSPLFRKLVVFVASPEGEMCLGLFAGLGHTEGYLGKV